MRRDDPGPYSLDALKSLPRPAFFERDASALKAKYIAWFEQASGRTVYPMQVEMLLIEALAYAMSLLGEEGQLAQEQAFVAFGVGESLDRLGPNRSTQRLPEAAAVTRLRFSLAAPAQWNIVIDAGSEVSAGGVAFATDGVAIIPAGALTAEVGATAVVAGASGNGFLPGQISTMAAPIDGVSCSNITTSEGGAAVEGDPGYQLRLANAFDRVSSGGGYGWYRETAMGVSSAIIDVGVVRPQPCYIEIYPLTASGAAGPDLRARVLAAFQTDRALENRFGDEVSVLAPSGQHRSPTLTVRAVNPSATLEEDARKIAMAMLAGHDFSVERADLQVLAKSIWGGLIVDGWGQRLAAIIAPSEVTTAVKRLPGVVDADLAALPFEQLGEGQYLVIDTLTVNVEVIG